MHGQPGDSRVTDLRLYRLSFVPALAALVVLMFSLEGIPGPIEPVTPTGTFEGDVAAATARQIARLAPEREPGSSGDGRIANLVAERFHAIPAGSVAEQPFEAPDGDSTALRNVILTLPGEAARTVVVLADRTSEEGPGAARSAAATGVLLELADALGVAGHDSTYQLASTAGGADGARALIDGLGGAESIEAVIVISQPGAPERREPFAVASSTNTRSGSLQLRRTAERAVEAQAELPPAGHALFPQLARLAFPSGLGEQAPLIADGVDSVAVSAAGERPLDSSEDLPEDVSEENIDTFGRAVHSLVGSVDSTPALEHGPKTYVEVADNLVPGWTLAALGFALLLPAGVAAFDAAARVSRRGGRLPAALGWAAARSLPFVGALGVLYGLALTGLVPRPDFPFDPGLYPLGARFAFTAALALITFLASAYLLRRFRVTAAHAPAGSVGAVGLVSAIAAVALWVANPYLGLLAAPAAHVWVLADRVRSRLGAVAVAIAALVSVLPALGALVSLSASLDLGADGPWTLTLMLADGQIGLIAALGACFAAGALGGAVALALSGGGRLPAAAGPA